MDLYIRVPEKIRVALARDVHSIDIAIKGPYKITTIQTNEVLKRGEIMWQGNFSPTKNGIKLKTYKEENFNIYGIAIIPKNEASIYVGNLLYRGTLQIIKTKEGKLTAVNVVDMEDYIKGVLYHEVSNKWPIEAIKAQAVASRTFAIYQAQERTNQDYYLNADVSSQVYRGVFAEKYRTNKAVEETSNQVLLYKGKVVPAFFHATCGGHTEDASNLWKVNSRPLKGVKCKFCINSPYYNWQTQAGAVEIENELKKNNHHLSAIKDIEIVSRNKSQRVNKVLIKDINAAISLTGKEIRSILKDKILKSTNFSVSKQDNNFIFHGHGWGHGVGMCQWGAFAMAKKRYGYKHILKHYYPGSEIITLKHK